MLVPLTSEVSPEILLTSSAWWFSLQTAAGAGKAICCPHHTSTGGGGVGCHTHHDSQSSVFFHGSHYWSPITSAWNQARFSGTAKAYRPLLRPMTGLTHQNIDVSSNSTLHNYTPRLDGFIKFWISLIFGMALAFPSMARVIPCKIDCRIFCSEVLGACLIRNDNF